ncbi:MAG: dienelactone hydrolase family protein [Spirochaetia bacterium]
MSNPVMGAYHGLALWSESSCTRPLSFLDPAWTDSEAWRIKARAKVHELLSYDPPACALRPSIDDVREDAGLAIERVSYAQPFGPRTEGFLLRPSAAKARMPGVVALHDHSAFKYFGKEKLVALDEEPDILKELKREMYGGRSWATELARRGYVVFVPDLFLWGSRRMDPREVPARYVSEVLHEEPGSRGYIEAYNEFAAQYETLVAKTLFLSGATWPGVMAWEDRRAMDYLAGRPEVDPQRLGCCGLSGGGLRTVYLAGLDPRVKCAICVGFMTVAREVLEEKIVEHTWMFHVPHLSRFMDLPDVISLHGPGPLMVQYNREDQLWTREGQEQADAKLTAIYSKLRAPDGYAGLFYSGPHKFDVHMQNDAFAWFDRWLS